MKICLDFDNTIFDTAEFYADFPCNSDIFANTFEMLHIQDSYTPLRHASLLRSRGIDITVEEIKSIYRSAPQHVRDREFLEKFCRKHEVYLVTRASHMGWQRKKANVAEVTDWFVEIRVVEGDEPKDYDDLEAMVDDNAEELHTPEKGILLKEEEPVSDILSKLDN